MASSSIGNDAKSPSNSGGRWEASPLTRASPFRFCGTGTHGVRPRGVVGPVGLSPEAKKFCCGGAVGSYRRVTRQQLCVNDAVDDLKTYVA